MKERVKPILSLRYEAQLWLWSTLAALEVLEEMKRKAPRPFPLRWRCSLTGDFPSSGYPAVSRAVSASRTEGGEHRVRQQAAHPDSQRGVLRAPFPGQQQAAGCLWFRSVQGISLGGIQAAGHLSQERCKYTYLSGINATACYSCVLGEQYVVACRVKDVPECARALPSRALPSQCYCMLQTQLHCEICFQGQCEDLLFLKQTSWGPQSMKTAQICWANIAHVLFWRSRIDVSMLFGSVTGWFYSTQLGAYQCILINYSSTCYVITVNDHLYLLPPNSDDVLAVTDF